MGRRQVAMKFGGNGMHLHPVKRHAFAGAVRQGTMALGMRDHRQRQRIHEPRQTVWVEDGGRRRAAPQCTREGTRRDGGRSRGCGLAQKSATSRQAMNPLSQPADGNPGGGHRFLAGHSANIKWLVLRPGTWVTDCVDHPCLWRCRADPTSSGLDLGSLGEFTGTGPLDRTSMSWPPSQGTASR